MRRARSSGFGARVSVLMIDAALPTRTAGRQSAGLSPELKLIREKFFRHIGQPLDRKEDGRLLTGKGRFTDDFRLPGQAYAAMVRSPHPHARIRSIDAAGARAVPGVLAVLTGADCIADGLEPIPHEPVPKTKYDMKLTGPDGAKGFISPHICCRPKGGPRRRRRRHGRRENGKEALDAAEKVVVDYDELPLVTEFWTRSSPALRPCGTRCPTTASSIRCSETPRRPTRPSRRPTTSSRGIPPPARHRRDDGAPRRARPFRPGYRALYALCRQRRRRAPEARAGYVLGVEPSQLRVLSFDVGGNFGSHNRVYVEFGLVLWASRKIGRPVKYTATRSETFLTDYQGRDLVTSVELALVATGDSSPCARTTSAMSARAASRCRRSARAPA